MLTIELVLHAAVDPNPLAEGPPFSSPDSHLVDFAAPFSEGLLCLL